MSATNAEAAFGVALMIPGAIFASTTRRARKWRMKVCALLRRHALKRNSSFRARFPPCVLPLGRPSP